MKKENNKIIYYYDETDEDAYIELKKIFFIFWKNKFKILLFSFFITALTIISILSKPEKYTSQTILTPQKPPKLSFVDSLHSISVVDISNGSSDSSLDPASSMKVFLKDINFETYMIKKYKLYKLLIPKREHLVFPLGSDATYNFLQKLHQKIKNYKTKIFHKHQVKHKHTKNEAKIILNTYNKIQSIIKITADLKTGLITLKAISPDRFLAKKIVDIYLLELTSRMREIEMQNVEKQMKYYKMKLKQTMNVLLQKQYITLISGLIQKKALSYANPLYNVFQLTKPRVPYIYEKIKSKKSVKIIASFIGSLIFGTFIAFLLEIRASKKEDKLSFV